MAATCSGSGLVPSEFIITTGKDLLKYETLQYLPNIYQKLDRKVGINNERNELEFFSNLRKKFTSFWKGFGQADKGLLSVWYHNTK